MRKSLPSSGTSIELAEWNGGGCRLLRILIAIMAQFAHTLPAPQPSIFIALERIKDCHDLVAPRCI